MNIEPGNDGLYFGTCPELPGTLIMGETPEEVGARLLLAKTVFSKPRELWGAFLDDIEVVPDHVLKKYGPTNTLLLVARPEALGTDARREEFMTRFRTALLAIMPPAGHA